MSTLVVATVKSASSAAPVFQNSSGVEKGQLVKAWVNFNAQGTPAIRDSFNVSSITDHDTGYFTLNFTNSMSDGNYVAYCQASTGNDLSYSAADSNYLGTGGVRVISRTSRTSNATDFPYVGVAVVGGAN